MKHTRLLTYAVAGIISCGSAVAQVVPKAEQLLLTSEDSLQAGYDAPKTVISGYGDAYYQRDFNEKKGTVSLERAVLFVGHQFNHSWSFFSELEVEDAKVAGGEFGGEVAMEQAYIRYNLNARHYFVAGLFIPRIGLLNENHLPVNFNGVERPLVQQLVIPATWRELGVAWYGTFNKLQLSAAIMNGLNSSGFEHGTGIREGRAEGRLASANNIAVSAAATYNAGDFSFQVSGYVGGTTDKSPAADSAHLDGGAFGTPIFLGEADLKWSHKAFSVKTLAALISYPDAGKVNATYGKNLPTGLYGFYAEAGYDVLYNHSQHTKGTAQLIAFARLEYMDLNAQIPEAPNGIEDGTLAQRHLIAGLSFMPIPNLVFKADVRLMHTGEQNPALILPPPNSVPYRQDNTFLNIGIGYSF